MKQVSYKLILKIFLLVLLTLFIARPYMEKGLSHVPTVSTSDYAIEIVDDAGYKIHLDKPATRIISLYSAHTENLFALDLADEVIGVGTAESFPRAALEKKAYDYNADPEKVISAQPDLVIIRPFIERHNPAFVDALRRSGLTVVSLYPENAQEFESYIMRLGQMTGREKKAEQMLSKFNGEMANLLSQTEAIDKRVGVYFESSDRDYTTVTDDSMAARAIEIAGGRNVATGLEAVEKGSTIAPFGLEHIVEIGDQIDVFVTQRGVMGAGGNWHSISIRPGFDTIKAIQEERVLEINQKIVSSPTFRQTLGIKEMMRYFYPDRFNDYSMYDKEVALTRRDFANLSVLYAQKPIFVPTSSYFNSEYRGHKFGYFEDISEADDDYYFVETAVLSGYIEGEKVDQEEYFYPDELLTKEDLAKYIFLLKDFSHLNQGVVINDLDQYESARIISVLVENGVFELDESGNFNGDELVTGAEAIKILEQL
ncbi:MAG: ABC transporter substrate-binding protein [Clostridia bacterium]|nr:ABC transporter substrate-binding protein [Clostridia bacterium]